MAKNEVNTAETVEVETTETQNAPKSTRGDLFKVSPYNMFIEKGFNHRTNFGDMEALEAEILAAGVLVPLKLRKMKDENGKVIDDKFLISAGHRRYTACMSLLKKGLFPEELRIPATLEDKSVTEADRLVEQVNGNSGKPLDPIEIASVIMHFIKKINMTEEEVAAKLGKKLAYINEAKTWHVAPTSIKRHVQEGMISATTVLTALRDNKKVTKKTPEKVFEIIEATVKTARAAGKTKITKADLLEEEKKHNSIAILKKMVFAKGVKHFNPEAIDRKDAFDILKKAYLGLVSEKQFENFFFEKE